MDEGGGWKGSDNVEEEAPVQAPLPACVSVWDFVLVGAPHLTLHAQISTARIDSAHNRSLLFSSSVRSQHTPCYKKAAGPRKRGLRRVLVSLCRLSSTHRLQCEGVFLDELPRLCRELGSLTWL